MEKRKEYSEDELGLIPCSKCGSVELQHTEVPDLWKCQDCGQEGQIKVVLIWEEKEG